MSTDFFFYHKQFNWKYNQFVTLQKKYMLDPSATIVQNFNIVNAITTKC